MFATQVSSPPSVELTPPHRCVYLVRSCGPNVGVDAAQTHSGDYPILLLLLQGSCQRLPEQPLMFQITTQVKQRLKRKIKTIKETLLHFFWVVGFS